MRRYVVSGFSRTKTGKEHPVTHSIRRLALLLVIALGVSACVTNRAQMPEPEPTLIVPAVPPRAIEPPLVVETPVEPPPVEPLPPPTTNSKPRPSRPAAESKADPKQDTPVEPVAATPAPAPVAQLRTPATPTGPEAIRQIREILDNTQKMLDSVQPPLSDDRKANLTSARALMQQSEEALRKEELTQARSFAERALNIAKVLLSGR
jgi:outer membrane biosynthesis protein TonB